MPAVLSNNVTLVTVTYEKRWHLLQIVLDSAFACGIQRCVVVNNGSHDDLARHCADRFGDLVRIVDLGRNAGSALGFKTGIEAALDDQAEFLMLVDDDNSLQPGAISKLLKEHHQQSSAAPDGLLAVVAFRPENQLEIAAGQGHRILHKNAFLGFHVKHLWKKADRLLRNPVALKANNLPSTAILDIAPYGGMLFHRSLIDTIGLPNASFVLYADDTEFSYRVTKMGGQLLVVTDARIVDILPSWNAHSLHRSAFHSWINGASDLSVFYAARNRACFERFYVEHDFFIRMINRSAFFLVLGLTALSQGNWRRFMLLREAILDGESNRLGVRRGFELT